MAEILPLSALGPRICIFGPSNAGKSTLADALGRKLDAPPVHLDLLRHQPNTDWVIRPDAEFAALHEVAISGERWIVEGNYMGLATNRLQRATGLIQIGSHRIPALYRYLRRSLFQGERLGRLEGARETINLKMLRFILIEQPRKRERDTAILRATGLPFVQTNSMLDLNRCYQAWDLRGRAKADA